MSETKKEELRVKWLPLESNPEVINKYVQNIGINTDLFEFTDIYGLDSELLAMVPKPCIAVLLLFPVTKLYQEYRDKQIEILKKNSQTVNPNVYFTRQTVSNACGTVALIHALANNKEILNIEINKTFGKFLQNTQEMTPAQRAEFLKSDDSMTSAHSESANEGQTETPSIDEELELHFIAYIQKDGVLYELDGAKEFPISHGEATAENLLEKSVEVVRKLI
jgi:ubiquitin carboxyl-terminal hydrolase L3